MYRQAIIKRGPSKDCYSDKTEMACSLYCVVGKKSPFDLVLSCLDTLHSILLSKGPGSLTS